MAEIPTYQRRVATQALPQVRAIADVADTSGLQRGLNDASSAALNIAEKQRQQADTTAVIGADTGLSNWTNDAMFNQQSGVYTKKGQNALNVTQSTLGSYDQQVQTTLDSLSNDAQRRRFQVIAAQRRESLSGTLNRYEYGEHQTYMNDVDKASIAASQNTAALNYSDPDAISQSHQKIVDVTRSQGERNGMAPEAIDVMVQKNTSSMYSDILRRQAAQDPYKAQSALKQYQQYLTADDITQVGSSIDAKVERLQQKAEMAQLRAEAKADRTLGRINTQIASGIPATDEMWQAWGSQVKGTAAAGEFNELRKAENETQQVLRRPIDEQIAYVKAKSADLQQNGGTVTEGANLARLGRAIDSNVKMMSEAPLDYFQQRLGGNVQPLDLTSDDAPNVLADRTAALQGMRQKFGDTVAMKPLLPQEAKQLSAQLDQMSPEQQSQTFAKLHDALGDDKAYAGAMQQIAPDSPVRALSGMIAGKQRSMTLNTHWFKPDDVVSGGDVAKTLALGESILNKSKADKSQDGTSRFPLPKSTDFQQELDKQLGTVFAGQPESYALASQAVRSYYTGASAQTGDISGEVDSQRMRAAIKATVGQVVDFNGNTTLAPWGMPEDTFHQVATQKLEEALSEKAAPYYGQKSKGMVELGNIDLNSRPRVKNADGSISTVRSMSANFDGKEVLIPTVSDDGRIMSNEESIQAYLKTGKNLGSFDNPDDATEYAERLHNSQAAQYVGTDPKALAKSLTLRQYRDGVYYVMQGQQFKYGADGKPLMLNLNGADK